jgi:hypothetical protein
MGLVVRSGGMCALALCGSLFAQNTEMQQISALITQTHFVDCTKLIGEISESSKVASLSNFGDGVGAFGRSALQDGRTKSLTIATIIAIVVALSWLGVIDKLSESIPFVFRGLTKTEVGWASYARYSFGICTAVIAPLVIGEFVELGGRVMRTAIRASQNPGDLSKWADSNELHHRCAAGLVACFAAQLPDIPDMPQFNRDIPAHTINQLRAQLVAIINHGANPAIVAPNTGAKSLLKMLQETNISNEIARKGLEFFERHMGKDTSEQRKQLGAHGTALLRDSAKQCAIKAFKWFGVWMLAALILHTLVYQLGITEALHNYLSGDWIDALEGNAHLRHAYQAMTWAASGIFIFTTVIPMAVKAWGLYSKYISHTFTMGDIPGVVSVGIHSMTSRSII